VTHNLGPATRDFRRGEFLVVLLLAFGLSIGSSLILFASNPANPGGGAQFDDRGLWSTVIFELLLAPFIVQILRHGGWRWSDFHFNYSNRGTLEGLGLAAFVMVADFVILSAFLGRAESTGMSGSWAPIIAVSVVNPLFEEFLVCAYVIEALRKRFGIATAVNVSIALRLSYHLYQGPIAFVSLAVTGVAFTFVYLRTGRLWPVIFAHFWLDLLPLSGAFLY